MSSEPKICVYCHRRISERSSMQRFHPKCLERMVEILMDEDKWRKFDERQMDPARGG